MTLRELLKTFNDKDTYYAILYAHCHDKNSKKPDFVYSGYPETITHLLDFLPKAILNKDVVNFGKYSLFDDCSYRLSESGKIVYIDFAITIEY